MDAQRFVAKQELKEIEMSLFGFRQLQALDEDILKKRFTVTGSEFDLVRSRVNVSNPPQ